MKPSGPYKPKRRLKGAYAEATMLNENGLQALCPSYTELAESTIRFQDSVLLGKGAVKEVYKTFNNHTQRWVAMARLRADRGPEFYDGFVHEAWLTASLNHPNIITIHDAGIDQGGRPFFTMDLKGDSSLADRISKHNFEGRRDLLQVFMKVCDAVAYAHSNGIIHLDLKPENIQADEFGEVLVCDWGLAKQVGKTEDGEEELPRALRPVDNMTLVGEIKGSLGFMAPEQVVPGAVKDRRTDVYALGCMLHLIVAGEPPFTGTPDEVLEATRKGEVQPPRRHYPTQNIPEALEAVIMKATARSPADRYSSAEALRDEIFNFLSGYSTMAEKPSFFREAHLFLARNRLPVVIIVCAIVALSIEGVLFVQDLKRQQQETAMERERAAIERERATEFEAKAESVSTLYQDEMARSVVERVRLARQLATSASNLKKLGIFIRPIETVREARKLLDSALALADDSASVILQRFSLNCITLNFKQAYQNPVTPESNIADYLLFVRAFPGFEYSETNRPPAEQLVTFFQHAREINPGRRALMERVMAYDHAARLDTEGYIAVVEAFLQYVSTQNTQPSLRYKAETSLLTLHSNGNIRLTVTDEWGSGECLLRFLPFRSFRPEVNGRLYLGDLHNLPLETLDLSGCDEVFINRSLDLPLLHTLYVRTGQFDVDQVRSVIKSNNPFKIIEE